MPDPLEIDGARSFARGDDAALVVGTDGALAVRAHTLLATSFGDAAAAEAFGAKVRARYPLADYFQPPEVLSQGIQDGKGASE